MRSADVSTCVVPRTLSSYGDRTFAAAGPRLWSSLPIQLRNPDITYGLSRRQLKGHLFREACTRRLCLLICGAIEKNTYLLTSSLRSGRRVRTFNKPSVLRAATTSRTGNAVCLCDPTFSRFCRTPTCGRQTDRHRAIVNSHTYCYLAFHHPLTLSFQAQNLPSLQILPTAALPLFYLNIYYVDSPGCLLLFLSISVFYF